MGRLIRQPEGRRVGCYSRVYFSTGYGSSMNRNDARPSRKNDDNIFELKYTFESKVFAKFSPFQEWNPLLHSAKKEFPKNFQFFFSKENFTPSKVDSKLECFRLFPFLLLPNRLFHRKKKKKQEQRGNNNFHGTVQSSIPNAAASPSEERLPFLFSLIFRNHTCTLPESFNNEPSFRRLLSENRLREVHNKMFTGLTNLKTL